MKVTSDSILAICTILGVLGSLFVWANKLNLAPFKVLVKSNTDAMQSLRELIAVHETKIEEHGERIATIEAKHSVRHGGE
jgi:uncharacterized protein involved in tolerance to divalent cations